MEQVLISVIIPTFNRQEILKMTLVGLEKQNFRNFETILIDDGGQDNTEKMVKDFLKNSSSSIKYFKKGHEGQGVARNFGIEKAKGKYILFLGDDMVPSSNLLEQHLKIHKNKEKVAVLGRVEWHPDLIVSDFMRWLAPCGFGFNFCDIKDPKNVDFSHFYTCNISLEKEWLENDKFAPDFGEYGFEDTELGYRLTKKGLRIVYNPEALVYHYHQVSLKEYCQKAEQIARALQILSQKHPELSRRWIKPVLPIFLISTALRKTPFLKYFSKNLYFLSEVTYHKYKILKCQKN